MNSLPVNSFKQALHANRRQVGLWVTFAHQQIAEVLACAGFDWLLFDMEHSPTDLYDVGQQLLAVRGTPTAAVVRVPILDMAWIKRVSFIQGLECALEIASDVQKDMTSPKRKKEA